MHAVQGDRIVIHGKAVGMPDRHGEILEVRGEEGKAPYLVKFDDGHETVVYPGGDFMIEHRESA
jgi:hypothetical protein